MPSRIEEIQRAGRPIMEFFRGPLTARRLASADPCDFVFGNPHDDAVPGLVEALRAASVPKSVDHFAYKFSEQTPRRAVAAALRDRLGMADRFADAFTAAGGSQP